MKDTRLFQGVSVALLLEFWQYFKPVLLIITRMIDAGVGCTAAATEGVAARS